MCAGWLEIVAICTLGDIRISPSRTASSVGGLSGNSLGHHSLHVRECTVKQAFYFTSPFQHPEMKNRTCTRLVTLTNFALLCLRFANKKAEQRLEAVQEASVATDLLLLSEGDDMVASKES